MTRVDLRPDRGRTATRAELRARITRSEALVEARRADLEALYEDLRSTTRFVAANRDPEILDPERRAAIEREITLYRESLALHEADLREARAALEGLEERLSAALRRAHDARDSALDALHEAACDARDAGEERLARDIDYARVSLVGVGIGALLESVAR